MSKLVIGTSKNRISSAIVKHVGPIYYTSYEVDMNGKLIPGKVVVDFNKIKDIGNNTFNGGFFKGWTVPTSVDFCALEKITGSYALYTTFKSTTNLTELSFGNLTDITGSYACYSMCNGATNLTSLDLSALTNVTSSYTFDHAFERTTSLTSLNLSSLKRVTGYYSFNYTFLNSSIRTADLSSLEVVTSDHGIHGIFESCKNLETLDISSLVTISNTSGFAGGINRTKLTTVSFDSLKNITGSRALYWGFCYCTYLNSVYFPAITTNSFGSNYNQFEMLVGNMSQTVTIHFPNNLDPEKGCTTISSLSDYPKFSNPNTILAFDLPSTAHLIGDNLVEYERNPKYDTQSALAWRVLDGGTINDPVIDWTPYYTSSTDDPTTGTTIYSDSTCTQAVTVVNSIIA